MTPEDWDQGAGNAVVLIFDGICVLFNARLDATSFVLPPARDGASWSSAFDSAESSPADRQHAAGDAIECPPLFSWVATCGRSD
ncbi:MAG TPA: hypothetical protein VFO19_21635 [Vicinamibacterales bacterium]|nr:hypothetical protein [Vicinamibacterales bacterium]